jgi:hypothetical protein
MPTVRHRYAAPVVFTLLAVGVLTGCGSSGGGPTVAAASGTPAGTSAPSASVAPDAAQAGRDLAQCLRDHGIPAKDPILPIAPGTNLATVFGVDPQSVSQAQLQRIQQVCAPQIQKFQQLAVPPPPWGTTDAQKLAFARCMRSHGVPNWPDPVAGSNDFPLQQAGVNRNDPAVQAAVAACQTP